MTRRTKILLSLVILGITVALLGLPRRHRAEVTLPTPEPVRHDPELVKSVPAAAPIARPAPTHSVATPSSSLEQVDALLQANDEKGALALLEKYLAAHPEDDEAWVRFGYLAAHNPALWPKAEMALTRILEKSPSHQGALSELLAVYTAQGKYEQGNRLFDELTSRGADPGLISVERGNFLLTQGRMSEAADSFRRAGSDEKRSDEALYGLAQAKSYSGDARGATDAYREFVDTMERRVRAESPASEKGHLTRNEESLIEGKLGLAASLIASGDRKAAEEVLKSVEERDPHHPELPALREWAAGGS